MLFARFLLVAFSTGSIACASGVTPAGDAAGDVADGAAATDAVIDAPADAPSSFPCVNVRECALYDRPTNVQFSNSVDCVAGSCVWAPIGGATCMAQSNGCLQCDTQLRSACPGDACLDVFGTSGAHVERTNCARDFVGAITACYGNFARLDDGTICVITDAPTGAVRYVLSCGACETVFTP